LSFLDIWTWFFTGKAQFIGYVIEIKLVSYFFLKLIKIGEVEYGQKNKSKMIPVFSWCSFGFKILSPPKAGFMVKSLLDRFKR